LLKTRLPGRFDGSCAGRGLFQGDLRPASASGIAVHGESAAGAGSALAFKERRKEGKKVEE
jgi:hypothetical protein